MMGTTVEFVENLGQLGEGAGLLYAKGGPISIAFFEDHLSIVVRAQTARGAPVSAAYDVDFLGANRVRPRGVDPTGTRYSFFLGNDPTGWVPDAVGFAGVVYRDLWDGVDLRYGSQGPDVKYELMVRPGGDPSSIRFGFAGAQGVAITDGGGLAVSTVAGCVRDEPPITYQCGPAEKVPVESGFVLGADGTASVRVGSYDTSKALIIDPRLIFGTYLGAGTDDWVQDCQTGAAGEVYIMGATDSTDFPTTTGALDPAGNGGFDLFVSKLSPNGTMLLHSTFIGGNGNDNGYYTAPSQAQNFGGICLDGSSAVYVSGHTNSTDFPTTVGAYDQTHNGGYDAFVLKLAPTLDSLAYSSYVGGPGDDFATDIGIGADKNAIVVGSTLGTFPTTSGVLDRTSNGADDAFAFELDPTGTWLLRSTYLGGTGKDWANAVDVDDMGSIVIVGATEGGGFPTKGAYDPTHNGLRDMFVAKLNTTWSGLAYSTFIGTSGQDYANDVRVDFAGRTYVVGYTTGGAFPTTTGSYQRNAGGGIDAVVLRLDASGLFLDKCTYLGGTSDDRGYGIALDPNGDVLVTGWTLGTVPTTASAHSRTNAGDIDLFLARFDGALGSLRYGSMFGGGREDKSWAVTSSTLGDVYVTGHTTSADFPTTAGALDRTYDGGVDGFLVKVGEPRPPAWRALPPLLAIEDVPLAVNFSRNVTDIDTPPSGLSISSSSPYVTMTAGLEVTFQFPNGVLAATVTLDLSDESAEVPGVVNITIAPVNDPPTCNLPDVLYATEDVPQVIDLAPYLSDVDNQTRDLRLSTSSQYAKVDNLTITLTFPEGVLRHDLWVNVSDGLATTEVHVEVLVNPVDDPPIVAALPTFEAVEDTDSTFNLTPYLSDLDTPVSQLHVRVSDRNITVKGQEIHCLVHRGNVRFMVTVEVSDATTRVGALLWVHVTEVDDPPIVMAIPPQPFIEDTQGIMDLSNYIDDEDTTRDSLIIECTDPHIVFIVGLKLVLLFEQWVPDDTVNFTVFDGSKRTLGGFEVQIQAINDAPIILGIGNLTPPLSIVIDEGSDVSYPAIIRDDDSLRFKFTMISDWRGISVLQNGTVHITTGKGDVGHHTAMFNVDDLNGGNSSVPIEITVRNVNDPPSRLLVIEPFNHTTMERGSNVTFSVDISDPDMAIGQVLTVTWTSNISGILRALSTKDGLHFTTNALPIGLHRITVNATDGQYFKEAWFEITVEREYVAPPPRQTGSDTLSVLMAIAGIVLAIFFFVLIAAMLVVMNRRGKAEEEVRATPSGPTAPASGPIDGQLTMEGDLARLSRNIGDMAAQLEAQRAAEAVVTIQAPPSAQQTAGTPEKSGITEEEEADREHTREVREVMRALTQLPQGLPTSLWGWDMSELARAVVDGEKRTAPDGTALVKLKGKWYNADRTNVGVFVREWKQPEAPAAPARAATTAEKRDLKLEQLETALLEGKISEQMYRELKRKYEGGG